MVISVDQDDLQVKKKRKLCSGDRTIIKYTFQVSEDALGSAKHFRAQNDGRVDDNHIQLFVSRK